MHGCGNDFVIFDERRTSLDLSEQTIAMLADRQRGVGFDQLICIRPDPEVAGFMHIYNTDGSAAGACGNATRCVADLIMRETGQTSVILRTEAGHLPARRNTDGSINVDMGPVALGWKDVPLFRPMDTLHLDLPGDPAGASMGNPHATFFVADLDSTDVAGLGQLYENDPIFPKRANIGFAQIIDRRTIRLRVWERGSGLTLACGSGACATLVNACRRGLTDREARIALDGGDLDIVWHENDHVSMAGPATMVFAGEVDLP